MVRSSLTNLKSPPCKQTYWCWLSLLTWKFLTFWNPVILVGIQWFWCKSNYITRSMGIQVNSWHYSEDISPLEENPNDLNLISASFFQSPSCNREHHPNRLPHLHQLFPKFPVVSWYQSSWPVHCHFFIKFCCLLRLCRFGASTTTAFR